MRSFEGILSVMGDLTPTAEAGDLAQTPAKRVLFADGFDLVRDRLQIDFHLLPLLPQAFQ